MFYSLVNRVRGIFLGALLGEILATQNVSNIGEIAVLGSQSLITLGKLDVEDWLNRYQKLSDDGKNTDTHWGKILLATLPVAIFFHEDPVKLKDSLGQLLQIWDVKPMVRDGSLVIGYAIAQCLTEKLDPFTLIPNTIDFLTESKTSIPENLLKVNNLLYQGTGLAQAQTEFSQQDKLTKNIALAFYCFLSSLEDFRLTVLRAKSNFPGENCWCCAVTGALSGAYNSTVGMDNYWQIVLSTSNQPIWGMSSSSLILELADELVAVWSGVYNINSNIEELTSPSIFAAPGVIRPG